MPSFTFHLSDHNPTDVQLALPSADAARREAMRTFGEIIASEHDELPPEVSLQVTDESGKPIVYMVLKVQAFDGAASP